MPIVNPHNRRLKAKMVMCGVLNKDIMELFKDRLGRQRSSTYFKARMAGKDEFKASEMLIFKSELGITDKDEFLETFFPGEKWA